MITVCAHWDSVQMPAELEWRMWRQLRGGFEIDRFVFTPIFPEMNNVAIDQYATIGEALASCVGQRVFLEGAGANALSDIPQGDIVLILGNTSTTNEQFAQPEEMYAINAPVRPDLYGINAAAIALAFHAGQ